MVAFNLAYEPWLTLRMRGGERLTCGFLDALLRSGDAEGLVVDLPTQLPALLRQLLLPVMVDALGLPASRAEWAERFASGRFGEQEREQLRSYVSKHEERFELFEGEAPFAQARGLRTQRDETKGSALLVATAATGNNVPLFASRTEGDPLLLEPAEAARWLLHVHCWDTAAIKTGAAGDPKVTGGKTTGNPTGPLGQLGVIMPEGRSFFDTLLLNTPIGSPVTVGTPQWRRKPADQTWEVRAPDGYLDLWTWQARRVRLIPEETADGVRVTRVVLTAGDRLARTPEWEPHTAWNFIKEPKSRTGMERRPRRHQPGKAIWRGMSALLSAESATGDKPTFEASSLILQLAALEDEGRFPEDYPLRLQTYGITYGNQSAVVEDVLHDSMPLPVAALRGDAEVYGRLIEITEQAEYLAQAVNHLSADLRRAFRAEPIPWDKGQRPGERVLQSLDPLVRRMLAGFRDCGADAERMGQGQLAWEQLAYLKTWDIAEELLAAVPAGAFAGREIEKEGKVATYRLGTAEHNFRRRLRQVLPRAAQAARGDND